MLVVGYQDHGLVGADLLAHGTRRFLPECDITHPEHFSHFDGQGRHDAYKMFVLGFQQPEVSASYIIAMVLLGLHLSHGIKSTFQSIGLTGPKYQPLITRIGVAATAVIVVGNISMPLAVLAGLVTLPAGAS